MLKEITETLADNHLKLGKGVLASALLLSIKDIEGAAMKLLRSNDIHYAFILTQLFEISCHDEIIFKIAENSSFLEETTCAKQVLEKIKKNKEKKLILLGNFGLTLKDISPGLKKLEDYRALAKESLSRFNTVGAVFNYIIAKSPEDSFQVAIDFSKSNKFNNF